jgi:bifunctional non-homologous end joining protein LigD
MNESVSLFLTEGTSDKEYHLQLLSAETGFVVNYQNGRRGGTLRSGTRTTTPIPYADAKALYADILKKKLREGYTPDVAGVAFQGGVLADSVTGILPQLLNSISDARLQELLADDDYVMQEKMDGHRRMVECQPAAPRGINKKGLQVALPQPLADAVASVPTQTVLDGEQIGQTLYLFDLLQLGTEDLREQGFMARYARLQSRPAMPGVVLVPVYATSAEKRAAFNRIKAAKGEGVVFKKKDAPYRVGRPSSGGSQLKYKFTESATLFTTAVSKTKRSVSVAGNDAAGKPVKLGNVTIPPNYDIPSVGSIVEVEYLYAYEGGSLFQPVFRGIRDDQNLQDCTLAQLKLKPKLAETEAEDDES